MATLARGPHRRRGLGRVPAVRAIVFNAGHGLGTDRRGRHRLRPYERRQRAGDRLVAGRRPRRRAGLLPPPLRGPRDRSRAARGAAEVRRRRPGQHAHARRRAQGPGRHRRRHRRSRRAGHPARHHRDRRRRRRPVPPRPPSSRPAPTPSRPRRRSRSRPSRSPRPRRRGRPPATGCARSSNEWRQIKGIDRKTDDALWKRFAAARDGVRPPPQQALRPARRRPRDR